MVMGKTVKLYVRGSKKTFGVDKLVLNRGTEDEKTYLCISGNAFCADLEGLSNEPNVRAVDEKANVIPKIEATLIDEPDMMPVRNNGISIIASSCQFDEKRGLWVITLNEDDGIINGGHTFYTIMKLLKLGLLKDFVKVPIRVFESKELTSDDIADMSACLNYTCSPKLSTLVEKRGLTENLKKALSDEYRERIEWKENTMEGKQGLDYITLDEFLMLLSLFDIKQYSYFRHERSKTVTKAPKTVVTGISNESLNFDYLGDLVNDIMRLYDEVNVSLTRVSQKKGKGAVRGIQYFCSATQKKRDNQFNSDGEIKTKTTVFTGAEYTYDVAAGFMYLIMTSFRANMQIVDHHVKWVVPDVVEFFKSIESDIWRAIFDNVVVTKRVDKDGFESKYIDVSGNTKAGKPIWKNLYTLVENKVFNYEIR